MGRKQTPSTGMSPRYSSIFRKTARFIAITGRYCRTRLFDLRPGAQPLSQLSSITLIRSSPPQRIRRMNTEGRRTTIRSESHYRQSSFPSFSQWCAEYHGCIDTFCHYDSVPVTPMTVNWLTIRKFAEQTGYSEHAIRSKIRDGVWLENHVWIKAPDNRVLVSVEGYNQWVESSVRESGQPAPPRSRSRSSIKASAAGKRSGSSPPPLI